MVVVLEWKTLLTGAHILSVDNKKILLDCYHQFLSLKCLLTFCMHVYTVFVLSEHVQYLNPLHLSVHQYCRNFRTKSILVAVKVKMFI